MHGQELHGTNAWNIPDSHGTLHGTSLEGSMQKELEEIEYEYLHGTILGLFERSRYRVDVNRRHKKDGTASYYGNIRERGRGKKWVGYLKAKEIPREDWERYTPRGLS